MFECDWSIIISVGWEYEGLALNSFADEDQTHTNQASFTDKLA